MKRTNNLICSGRWLKAQCRTQNIEGFIFRVQRSLKVIDVLVRKNGSQEEYDRCQNSETKVN